MTRAIVLLAVMALLGACEATPQQNLPVAQPATSTPAPASATLACPSPNFEGFLKVFISDVEAQKEFSAKPLESQTVDATAEPEPALVTKMLTATELEFPLIPSEQQQANEGLKMRQSVLENGDIKVTLAKEDTDYQMSFYFKKEACWKLIRIRNDSL
ncbi:hypothetical protein [Pseudoxanthomonas sacheonensis]|uniref:Lipoprotein n=1 Tax=Pseudoxanthomonas sacheonensis TaxID=443615 RepID=A0ABU1RYP4_9GAMM|nr:hypothetical protein [Pseudoxanthomonas sacheonensis]MDR6843259.1 hypothetical protein [Pseudoxanthomonas sacheonensis]